MRLTNNRQLALRHPSGLSLSEMPWEEPTEVSRALARCVGHMQDTTDLAFTAIDRLSAVYSYAELKALTTVSAVNRIRSAANAASSSGIPSTALTVSRAEQAAHEQLLSTYLQNVNRITELAGDQIMLLTAHAFDEMYLDANSNRYAKPSMWERLDDLLPG